MTDDATTPDLDDVTDADTLTAASKPGARPEGDDGRAGPSAGEDPARSDRLEELERRVRDLEDRLLTLVNCVEFDPRQPYLAQLSRLEVGQSERIALGLVLGALLQRARGEVPKRPHRLPPGLSNLTEVFELGPISRDDAVRYVARVLGVRTEVAEAVLVAHRDSGLGAQGHLALGT